MAKTHLLACQHEDCAYASRFMAGELPVRCPTCRRFGFWRIERVYEWTLTDFAFLRGLQISPE